MPAGSMAIYTILLFFFTHAGFPLTTQGAALRAGHETPSFHCASFSYMDSIDMLILKLAL